MNYRKHPGKSYGNGLKSSEEPQNAMAEALKKAGFRLSDNQLYSPLEIFDALKEFCGDVGIECNACRTHFSTIANYCGKNGQPDLKKTNPDFKLSAVEKLERLEYLPLNELRRDFMWYTKVVKTPVFRISKSKLYQKALQELAGDKTVNESEILKHVREMNISGFVLI